MIEIEGYRIDKKLGGGAQSEVCAATCLETGRAVVVKVYKREVASVEVSRVNREFQLLRELSACAGVPDAIEITMVGACPAIVTGFSEGISLRTYVRERQEKCAAGDFLEIALQAADILAQLHAAHIVHKDVKPQNVIVQPETLAVRLIDFGIATRLGHAQTYHDAPTRGDGTWVYAAPEQSGGLDRGIDFRTDLYGLGSVLYLLLTGRPPFVESDTRKLVRAHLTSAPTPPDVLDPDTPPALSRIVSKLLAKEPDERYQTAAGLRHDLAECRAQLDRRGEIARDFEPGRGDAEAQILFSGALVDREAEARTLVSALDHAAAGKTRRVLISGSAGIGKSSLVGALARPIAERGGQIVRGKANLGGSKAPYHVIVSALRTWLTQLLCRDPEDVRAWGAKLRAALGNIAGVLPTLVEDFATVLGDVPEVPQVSAAQTRGRLLLAIERLVRAMSEGARPLVLVFDDLQWADEASVAVFSALARFDDVPLLLIGTHRDVDVPARVLAALETFRSSGAEVDSIALRPLSPAGAARMLARALRRSEADALRLANAIGPQTEYNPFLVQRVVWALHDGGLLRFRRGVGWDWDDAEIASAALPVEIAELLAEKVAVLDERTVGVLKLASCVGDEFDVDLLARLSRDPRTEIEAALFALCDAALIRPCRIGYRFGHDRIREATLDLFSVDERRALHHELAGVLLEGGVPEDPDDVVEIADHLLVALPLVGGAVRLPAIEIFERAAEYMFARLAFESAQSYVEAGLELFDASGEGSGGDWEGARRAAFALHVARARVFLRLHQLDRVREVLDLLETRTWTERERVELAGIAIMLESARVGPLAAMDEVVAQARHFDLHWRLRPSRLGLAIRWRWYLGRWLRRPVVDRLDRDEGVLSEEDRCRLRFLALVGGPVNASGSWLAQLTCECASDLYFRNGAFRSPVLTLVGWAIIAGRRRSYLAFKRVLELALAWEERCPDRVIGPRARWTIQRLLCDFTQSKRFVLAKNRALIEELLEAGDTEYVLYAELYALIYSAELGATPEALRNQVRQSRMLAIPALSMLFRQINNALTVLEVADAGAAERAGRDLLDGHASARTSPLTDLRLWTLLSLALSARGHYRAALFASELARRSELLEIPFGEVYVAHCVALAGVAQQEGRRLGLRERTALRQMERRLARKARFGSTETYLRDFIRGERLCMSGRSSAGLALLDAVGRAAMGLEVPNFAALAHHRRALHLLALRRETEADKALALARSAYVQWGASGAVADVDALRASLG